MGKYITLVMIVLAVLALVSCSVVWGEPQMYEVTSDIHSLDIQINAADFSIVDSDAFRVESNLKTLSVSETNGVLSIKEKNKVTINDTNAMLRLCIPKDIVFEKVEITTGAGRLTTDSLSADSLNLKLGAGKVFFGSLNAHSHIDIEGGAGEITVSGGSLNNLNLRLGVGKFKLTAALLGNSDLQFGVGESNLTLVGSPDDYKLDITKGIGSVHVDGYTGSDFGDGNARNHVKIQGGIGTANIAFQN